LELVLARLWRTVADWRGMLKEQAGIFKGSTLR